MLNISYAATSVADSLSPREYQSDPEIWQTFKDGDEDAFAFIYERYSDELFSYGMKVKMNSSLVQDCMHDLFVDLWRQRKNLASTDHIKFYLFKALRRRIIYAVERESKLYAATLKEDFEEVTVSFPFENILIDNQSEADKRRKIKAALYKLSERQREVLDLLFFREMSYEEISDIMAINVRSVYTLAWKAITSMKKHLKEVLIIPLLLTLL